MNSIIGDLTSDTISIIFKECEKNKNKKRIQYIINNILDVAFGNIKPYLYTIMGILILLFLMNLFQFYYYIRLFIQNQNQKINFTLD
jgi:hypothetical protein